MEDDFVSMENVGASTDGGESRVGVGRIVVEGQKTVWMQLNRDCIRNEFLYEGTGGWIIPRKLESMQILYYQTQSTSDSTLLEYTGHFSSEDSFETSLLCAHVHCDTCTHHYTTYSLDSLLLQLYQYHIYL